MPNWCNNSLTIKSDNYGQLLQYRNACLSNEPNLLEMIRPFTEETNYEWDYDWCVDNWGTKWDVCDVMSCYLIEGELTIVFDTAWSPPVAALQYGAKRHGFTFELEYYEPGMMYAGFATEDGDEVYEYTFDVHPCEELPDHLVDAHGIDRDYDYWLQDMDDDDVQNLSDDQKEYRKMLMEGEAA